MLKVLDEPGRNVLLHNIDCHLRKHFVYTAKWMINNWEFLELQTLAIARSIEESPRMINNELLTLSRVVQVG